MLRKTCLLLLLFLQLCGFSQSNDSLRQALAQAKDDITRCGILYTLIESEADDKVWVKDNDRLFQIAESRVKAASHDTIFPIYLAFALNNYGYYYMEQSQPDKALYYYKQALAQEERNRNKPGMAAVYNNMGYLLRNQGNITEALDYYHKGMKMQIESNDQVGLASSYNNIAYVFEVQKETKQALEYYQKALSIYEKIGNKDGIANSYSNIAYIYKNFGDLEAKGPADQSLKKSREKALAFLQKALQMRRETNDQKGIADNLNLIGQVMLTNSKSCSDSVALKAQAFLNEALMIREKNGLKPGMADSYNTLGGMFYECGNLKEAEAYARKDLKVSMDTHSPDKVMDAAYLLFKVSQKNGNYREALDMHVLYLQMRDSILNESTRQEAVKKTYQLEYEKKAVADSVRTEEERKVLNAQIRQQRTEKIALFAGIALVGLFSIFMYNRFRVTRKQKQLIELKEKETYEQKMIIEKKHQEITDSINYAHRIQRALITSERYIDKQLKRMKK